MPREILAIIPARGGSKGVPRKNVRLLAGKPLIAHAITAAHHSKYVSRVVVSTDDLEIGEAAQRYGADIVWRPTEFSGDQASSEAALLHTLEHLRETEEYAPEIVVFIQCTSPLTLPEDIDGTVRTLIDANANSALSVAPFHYYIWRSEGAAGATGINHDKSVRLLRQQREPQYLETGAVYVMRAQQFLSARRRFFGTTALYVMPSERCLEIDAPVDLQVAEVLLASQRQRIRGNLLPAIVKALVLDFDGVMTDNRVLVLENGIEGVLCDRADGMGIEWLRLAGIPVLVLSKEQNPVVKARCRKLAIECEQGVEDKAAALRDWLSSKGIDAASTIYVGNDVNDIPCMRLVGCPVAVADAQATVHLEAKIVLDKPGGAGAVREIAQLILEHAETNVDVQGG